MADARSLRAPLLWTGYVLLPALVWWRYHHVSVGVGVAMVLFGIWWTWRFRGALPGPWILITVLLIAKLLAGFVLSVERGLEADYFSNADWTPPVSFKRIDRRLLYRNTDAAGRETLPFSVVWQAYVPVTRAKDRRTFYLRGRSVSAELWVDGAQTAHLESGSEEAVDRARWPAGLRHLTVRLSGAAGGSFEFEAGFIDGHGRQHPLGVANAVTRPYPQWRLVADRIFGPVVRTIDGLFLAVLFGMFFVTAARMIAAARVHAPERRDAVVALLWIAIMAAALIFARPVADRLVVPGDRSYHQPLYDLTLWIVACVVAWYLVRVVNVLVPPEAE
jgi:hypothetical protein